MTEKAELDSREDWFTRTNERLGGTHHMTPRVPRHVLERIEALIGPADMAWIEPHVPHPQGGGLTGDIVILTEKLMIRVQLDDVNTRVWPGSREPTGTVAVRVVRRSDLDAIEIPPASDYDNSADAWSHDNRVDGTWPYRCSIRLTYRDGTQVQVGDAAFGNLFDLLPSLREDLLAQ